MKDVLVPFQSPSLILMVIFHWHLFTPHELCKNVLRRCLPVLSSEEYLESRVLLMTRPATATDSRSLNPEVY